MNQQQNLGSQPFYRCNFMGWILPGLFGLGTLGMIQGRMHQARGGVVTQTKLKRDMYSLVLVRILPCIESRGHVVLWKWHGGSLVDTTEVKLHLAQRSRCRPRVRRPQRRHRPARERRSTPGQEDLHGGPRWIPRHGTKHAHT